MCAFTKLRRKRLITVIFHETGQIVDDIPAAGFNPEFEFAFVLRHGFSCFIRVPCGIIIYGIESVLSRRFRKGDRIDGLSGGFAYVFHMNDIGDLLQKKNRVFP